MAKTVLLWFRKDLRLQDNEAVAYAISQGWEILPFFHYDLQEDEWGLGGATQWWLHHALEDFSKQISELGGQLVIGNPEMPTAEALAEIVESYDIECLLWNRSYEPAHIKRDTALKTHFREKGLEVRSFNSSLLFEPTETYNKSGNPFKVFTPFWKALREEPVNPVGADLSALKWAHGKTLFTVSDLRLLPKINWDTGFYSSWNPTRAGALERVSAFLPERALSYPDHRDRPDLEGTSKLSPYLHFGQIGPRELLSTFRETGHPQIESGVGRQLFWREFALHLLYHFNWTPTQPLYEKYVNFPWEENPAFLHAWQKGETGYPIVDAAMRELWVTGWMHNRARMIVGSVLVKHLLQPWQEGAAWFWDTLVDADLANNTLGWQWVAGCGADGAPYFRVFNPITQGQKFDLTGGYVRKWCPELKDVPQKYLHCPWEAPPLELKAAGVTLGKTYPIPIVGHKEGRQRALDAFSLWKERNAGT